VGLRVLLGLALALAGFAAVALPAAALIAWRYGEPVLSARAVLSGTVCALTTWLFVFIFHFRRETICVPVSDRAAFCERLRGHLQEMGYRVTAQSDGRLVGRPAFHSYLLGDKIQVGLADGTARLTGPKVYLELLRRRLRLHTHFEQVPFTLARLRHRQGDCRLREVRITLQSPGAQLPSLYHEIAAALSRERAEIHCELSIRARSDRGLSEQFLETHVHHYLKARCVPVVIHKELLEADETEPAADEARSRKDTMPEVILTVH
jgi:hypothetical protein